MEIVIIRNNVVKNKDATITRLMNRLSREITNLIKLQYYIDLQDMVNIAFKIKR
jgi:hypothetical protein